MKNRHVVFTEPSCCVGFSIAISGKLLFYIRHDDVELPISSAILGVRSRDLVGGQSTDFLLELSLRGLLRRFSVTDGSPRNTPCTGEVDGASALLEEKALFTLLRAMSEEKASTSEISPMNVPAIADCPVLRNGPSPASGYQ